MLIAKFVCDMSVNPNTAASFLNEIFEWRSPVTALDKSGATYQVSGPAHGGEDIYYTFQFGDAHTLSVTLKHPVIAAEVMRRLVEAQNHPFFRNYSRIVIDRQTGKASPIDFKPQEFIRDERGLFGDFYRMGFLSIAQISDVRNQLVSHVTQMAIDEILELPIPRDELAHSFNFILEDLKRTRDMTERKASNYQGRYLQRLILEGVLQKIPRTVTKADQKPEWMTPYLASATAAAIHIAKKTSLLQETSIENLAHHIPIRSMQLKPRFLTHPRALVSHHFGKALQSYLRT